MGIPISVWVWPCRGRTPQGLLSDFRVGPRSGYSPSRSVKALKIQAPAVASGLTYTSPGETTSSSPPDPDHHGSHDGLAVALDFHLSRHGRRPVIHAGHELRLPLYRSGRKHGCGLRESGQPQHLCRCETHPSRYPRLPCTSSGSHRTAACRQLCSHCVAGDRPSATAYTSPT